MLAHIYYCLLLQFNYIKKTADFVIFHAQVNKSFVILRAFGFIVIEL